MWRRNENLGWPPSPSLRWTEGRAKTISSWFDNVWDRHYVEEPRVQPSCLRRCFLPLNVTSQLAKLTYSRAVMRLRTVLKMLCAALGWFERVKFEIMCRWTAGISWACAYYTDDRWSCQENERRERRSWRIRAATNDYFHYLLICGLLCLVCNKSSIKFRCTRLQNGGNCP